MENPVEKALHLLGDTLWEASKKLDIQPSTLWKWKDAGRVKHGPSAIKISDAVQGAVTIRELLTGEFDNGNGGRRKESTATSCDGGASASESW
jgi:hypothetical protein